MCTNMREQELELERMTTPEERADAYGDLRWKGRRGYPVMKDDCVEDYLAGYAQAIEDLKQAWPSEKESNQWMMSDRHASERISFPPWVDYAAWLKRTVLERLEK